MAYGAALAGQEDFYASSIFDLSVAFEATPDQWVPIYSKELAYNTMRSGAPTNMHVADLSDVQINDRVRFRVRQKTPGAGWITYPRNGGWYTIHTRDLPETTQVALICHPLKSEQPRLYRLLAIPDATAGENCIYEWRSPDGKTFKELYGTEHPTIPDAKCYYDFGKIRKDNVLKWQKISECGATVGALPTTLYKEMSNGIFQRKI